MPPAAHNQPPAASMRWGSALPLGLLLTIFSALFLPVVLMRAGGTSEYADMVMYHMPIIERMLADWPRVDVVHYESATTPGFHVLMAAAWRMTGREAAMLAMNSLFGVTLIAAVYFGARRYAGGWGALALTLPLAFSPYVLGATIWLTTDNAAMLFVTLALGTATIARASDARLLAGGIAAAAAVSMRQIHVWLAAPLGFAGLIASPLAVIVPRALRWGDSDPLAPRRSAGALAAGCIAAALPLMVLGYFMWRWGWKLTPVTDDPAILKHARGPNPAAPAFALALTGAFGVFFVPLCWKRMSAIRPNDAAAWFVTAAALALATFTPTSYLWTEEWMPRAYGWLWRIVEKFPAPMDRSVIITSAAPVGGLILLAMYRSACDAGKRVPAGVLLLSMLGWLCAQTMNSMAWQRYFEPFILLMLIWLGAMTCAREGPRPMTPEGKVAPPRASRRHPWSVWLGPPALAACQLGLCAITLYREVFADILRR